MRMVLNNTPGKPVRRLVQELARFPLATIYQASTGARILTGAIRPLWPEAKLSGIAFTVQVPECENLMIHHAIYQAEAGDVIMAAVEGDAEAANWGMIMTVAAIEREIAGYVTDGCVRDSQEIRKLGFPIFCRGIAIKSTRKEAIGFLNRPIGLGGALIWPGDIVFGDHDGVLLLSPNGLEAVLERAHELESREKALVDALRQGRSTLELYKWGSAE